MKSIKKNLFLIIIMMMGVVSLSPTGELSMRQKLNRLRETLYRLNPELEGRNLNRLPESTVITLPDFTTEPLSRLGWRKNYADWLIRVRENADLRARVNELQGDSAIVVFAVVIDKGGKMADAVNLTSGSTIDAAAFVRSREARVQSKLKHAVLPPVNDNRLLFWSPFLAVSAAFVTLLVLHLSLLRKCRLAKSVISALFSEPISGDEVEKQEDKLRAAYVANCNGVLAQKNPADEELRFARVTSSAVLTALRSVGRLLGARVEGDLPSVS